MHLQSFLAASLSLAALSSASISGIVVPSTIGSGSTISVTITTQDFIQTVSDIAIAFGIAATPALPANESVGTTFLGSNYLGPGKYLTLGRSPKEEHGLLMHLRLFQHRH